MPDTTSEAPAVSQIVPAGLHLKTHIFRDGNWLRATVYLCAAGSPEVMNFSVDLRPIVKAATRYHRMLHAKNGGTVAGFPGNVFKAIKKTVNSVAKGKVMQAIGKGVKSALSSKITGAITGTIAVVFPPVGIPAAAAYATAHQVISAVDAAKHLKLSMLTKFPLAATGIKELDAVTGPLAAAVKNLPADALKKLDIKLPANMADVGKYLADNPQVKDALLLSAKAKAQINGMVKAAKSGNKEAQAGVKVMKIAAETRKAIQSPASKVTNAQANAPGAFRAVIIDTHGNVVKGKFLDKSVKSKPGTAIMLRGKKVYRGTFSKVAGEIIGTERIVGSLNHADSFEVDKIGPDPDSDAALLARAIGCNCDPV